MNSVFICDDDEAWLNRIKHCVESYQVSSDWLLETKMVTKSPYELKEYISWNKPTRGIYIG